MLRRPKVLALVIVMAILLSLSIPIWSPTPPKAVIQPARGAPLFAYATPDPEVLRFGESSTVRLEVFNVGDSPVEIRGVEIFWHGDPAISGIEVIDAFPKILPPKGNLTVHVIVRTSKGGAAPEGGRALIARILGPDVSCPIHLWLVKRRGELKAEAQVAFRAGRLFLNVTIENVGDGPASGPSPSIFPPEAFELVQIPSPSSWELGAGERATLMFELRNSTALSKGLWEIPILIEYGVMAEDSNIIAERVMRCAAKFNVDSGDASIAFRSYGSSRWEIRYRIKVGPSLGQSEASLRLRLPPNNAHQEVISESFDPAPDRFEADRFGNRVAAWAMGRFDGDFEVGYRAIVIAKWIRTRPPLDGLMALGSNWGSLLAPEPMIESGSEEIRATADGFNGTDVFDLAARIFEFVQRGIKYVPHSPEKWFAREPMGQGALMTLRTKFGICTDKADLLVALYRAKGLPARRSIGAVAGGFPTSGQGHAWVEVWIPGCGFVPCDPTNELSFGEISQREVCLYYGQGLSVMPAEIEGGSARVSFEMSIGEPGSGPGAIIPIYILLAMPWAMALAFAILLISKRLV
ncbi:MAG: transglutaminase domain-containing protein [Candidatus Bathyarchaeia archaeon]